MSIGIIGAGGLGSNIARMFAKGGISATIANRRGPQSLAPLVEELGPSISAGSVEEAANADIVVAAVRWADAQKVFGSLPSWSGRIVIDATNPVEFLDPDSPARQDPGNPLAAYGIRVIDLGGRHPSAVFREWVPGARLVKAFNHLEAGLLPREPEGGGQRVLFYSGDDEDARGEVRSIVERVGHFPVDLGSLDVGGPLTSPFGALASINFVKVP